MFKLTFFKGATPEAALTQIQAFLNSTNILEIIKVDVYNIQEPTAGMRGFIPAYMATLVYKQDENVFQQMQGAMKVVLESGVPISFPKLPNTPAPQQVAKFQQEAKAAPASRPAKRFPTLKPIE